MLAPLKRPASSFNGKVGSESVSTVDLLACLTDGFRTCLTARLGLMLISVSLIGLGAVLLLGCKPVYTQF